MPAISEKQLDRIMAELRGCDLIGTDASGERELIKGFLDGYIRDLRERGESHANISLRVNEGSMLGFRVRGVDVHVLVWAKVAEEKL